MNKNILPVVFISIAFALSIFASFNLTIALFVVLIYLVVTLKSEQWVIVLYLFIYLCLNQITRYLYFGYGGQTINFLGLINLMLILTFYIRFRDFVHIKEEHWNKTLLYPVFIFMVCLLLTTPLSKYLTTSIRALNRTLSVFCLYLLSYYVAVHYKDVHEKIFRFVIGILFVLSVYGIIEYITGYNIFMQGSIEYDIYEGLVFIKSFKRIRTTFMHPSFYAFAILTVLPLVIYYFDTQKKKRYLFFIALLLINIVFTFTRIAWVAVTLQIILSLFLFRPRSAFLFCLLLAPVCIFMFGQIAERMTADNSAVGRLELFKFGFSLFKASPLFGHGPGSFLKISPDRFGQEFNAHGDYMKMFAETGILGGISYLVLLFSNLVFAVKNFKNNDLAKVAFLTSIGFMVFSITDNGLAYSHIFWGMLGIYHGIIVRENACKSVCFRKPNRVPLMAYSSI